MTDLDAGLVRLSADGATAAIALRGAEPVSWQVGGRELLWSGDPEHWAFHAPILFPRVGASAGGGTVEVAGRSYPMPQHGFARRAAFAVIERTDATVRLRLCSDAETRVHYPFSFALDVVAELEQSTLSLGFEVRNADIRDLPYAVGFHPAFPWPLDGTGRDGHRVVFADPERAEVPEVAAGGLLARRTRSVPLDGAVLPLAPDLFTEALVFLDAHSRAFRFEAASGAAIGLAVENFPHLAVWSRPDAPFLSLECWSGHADWEDAQGELAERASMTILPPGSTGLHRAVLTWQPPPHG
ncbi:MAG: aldose 1-epimerase family protein [Enterovirga sp.]|nr:aldose 1-epimerase family protein [Enterovirga sp.]